MLEPCMCSMGKDVAKLKLCTEILGFVGLGEVAPTLLLL